MSRSKIRIRCHKIIAIALVIAILGAYCPRADIVRAASLPVMPGGSSLPSADPMFPELREELAFLPGMSVLGPAAEPVGMFMDIGAIQEVQTPIDQVQFAPASVANPMLLSRVQSVYAAHHHSISTTLVITFTVTNNNPPSTVPEPCASCTITETISATLSTDLSQDSNVIKNVLLSDSLARASATFVSSYPVPDCKGDRYVWNLGDMPPLGSATVTLKVQVPSTVTNFIALDEGATAYGTLKGSSVSANTAPATLAPDAFGQWLKWTVDADYYDEYMLKKAAELGFDPIRMFEYVRSLDYECYRGSLRGTRGTIWGGGNSLDQASLLIAMLRGARVPARYVHGTLSEEQAQELILSMFPKPTRTIGHIPPDAEVSDPADDPQLLEETIDHWWVETCQDGQWIALDPSFSYAQPGQVFAENVIEIVDEVPDHLRHKVTMTVKVERWDKLSNLTGGLEYRYPLSHTFNTVELVGKPVTLGHLVNTDAMAGMAFWRVQHIYTPYFAVGDWEDAYEGEPFQDVLSNFPFGNFTTTGEWLLFDVRDAGRICRAAR